MKHVDGTNIIKRHMWLAVIVALMLLSVLFYYQWIVGTIATIIVILASIYIIIGEKKLVEEMQTFVKNITYQIDEAGDEVFFRLPIGIIVYNDAYKIEWFNPYVQTLFPEQSLTNQSLTLLSENILRDLEKEQAYSWLYIDDLIYFIQIDYEHKILYLFDRTTEKRQEQMYYKEKLVLGNIYLDNYEEISSNLDDTTKSQLNTQITQTLNQWAVDYNFYLKRTSQERFLAVLTQESLGYLEKDRFEILEDLKKITLDEAHRNPITLSIGVGVGNVSIIELAELAQSSLDLALGRGGDQVVIRNEEGKVRFYGGTTNPMEKRTRVRARVISHALKELVQDSDNVIIMGHKSPDMDALGAAIGILNIASSNDVEGYIILDENDMLAGISRVIDKIKQEETLWKHFISPEEAEAIMTSRSLVVVVDTHRPALVAHEKLVHQAERKVVIDHHRRGEDFIQEPTLVYMEPYASSTAELVTELIEYQPEKKKLSTLEATALLSGIIVDTKSFALRTGSRTFDAASYLRSKGANPVLIQDFLKEDLSTMVQRNKLVDTAYIHQDTLVIATGDEESVYNQITIAQAADILLTVDNVEASFVIAHLSEDTISVSARSLGDVNVQLIMEEMNGGGHLTNAATQIEDTTVEEVEKMLKEKISLIMEGS